ncbi:hypothetical protein F2Q68_00010723 [Brassica cretica]|uniref:Uncharacterized protein n=1 Tax=Brassica cretica TaxID=69181 RepID=A0A8S9KS88_BRACR|nr:hypothetical protein F2Q68_00010723 [Brassica cretica]
MFSPLSLLRNFCVGSLFSLSEVFHFLEGSSVPGTELRVPSSGDLERSLIGDPRFWVLRPAWRLEEIIPGALKPTGVAHSQQAPLRQDPVPLISISWVALKPELILNPSEDRFLRVCPESSSSFSYLLEMMRLEP